MASIVRPGPRHWPIFRRMCVEAERAALSWLTLGSPRSPSSTDARGLVTIVITRDFRDWIGGSRIFDRPPVRRSNLGGRRCAPTNSGCGSPQWPMCSSRLAPHRARPHSIRRRDYDTNWLKLLKTGALVKVSVRPSALRRPRPVPTPGHDGSPPHGRARRGSRA